MQLNWIEITGWINCIVFSFLVIPQIIKTVRTKTVSGVSIWVYIFMVFGNIDAFVYALLINQQPLQVKYAFGFTVSILYIYVYYDCLRKEKYD